MPLVRLGNVRMKVLIPVLARRPAYYPPILEHQPAAFAADFCAIRNVHFATYAFAFEAFVYYVDYTQKPGANPSEKCASLTVTVPLGRTHTKP